MTTQTITLPCKITFEWFPKEIGTALEPDVEEEFQIYSMDIIGTNVTEYMDYNMHKNMEDVMLNAMKQYLKENKDE